MEDARLEVLSIAQAAKDEADETYKQVIAKASSKPRSSSTGSYSTLKEIVIC